MGKPIPSSRWPIGTEVSFGTHRGTVIGYPGPYSLTLKTPGGKISGGTECVIEENLDIEALADKALE